MSQKTKIDWADATWNPVTGCLKGCEYCYAAKMARRFGGPLDAGSEPAGVHDLSEPVRREDGTINPYPYGFDPTFHRYRRYTLLSWTKPRSIFVCSTADLFGEWVPDEWILEVLQVCLKMPRHRYIFLTKNPTRYNELYEKYRLFRLVYSKYYFGATVTTPYQAREMRDSMATWLSIEPLLISLAPILQADHWKCVVVGAETGNRKKKVIPRKGWVDDIASICDKYKTPLFMKESLRAIMGDDFRQDPLPWEVKPA